MTAVLATHATAADDTVMKDPDGDVCVVTSKDWVHNDEDKRRHIAAVNRTLDGYFTLTHIRKKDSTIKNLPGFVEVSFRNDVNNGRIRNSQLSGPKAIKVNGYPAIQYEQSCTIGEYKVVMVRTFVETEGSWNAIFCWSLPTKAEACRPEFDRILRSFTELRGTTTQPEIKPDL